MKARVSVPEARVSVPEARVSVPEFSFRQRVPIVCRVSKVAGVKAKVSIRGIGKQSFQRWQGLGH